MRNTRKFVLLAVRVRSIKEIRQHAEKEKKF